MSLRFTENQYNLKLVELKLFGEKLILLDQNKKIMFPAYRVTKKSHLGGRKIIF